MPDLFEGNDAVIRTIALPPDPSIARALGGHHSLDSAVADLVDNALDASATRVRVRFVEDDSAVLAVLIADNGSGMSQEGLVDAMTIGKRREYGSTDLGHFGMGLKAASLSQASSFTVWSRAADASAISAIRIRRDEYAASAQAEIVDATALEAVAQFADTIPESTHGTVVQWNELRSVTRTTDRKSRTAWLSQQIDLLCLQLGVIFHRLIEDDGIVIEVDVLDAGLGRAGVSRVIEAIDPFAFRVSGSPLYPMTLQARTVSTKKPVPIVAYVLPPKTESSSARLFGRPRTETQGFFVYRNRRLLQAGGWNSVRTARSDLQLARVRIDVTDSMSHLVRINAEKRGVEFLPEFAVAVEGAVSKDGDSNFIGFLETAQHVLKMSQARRKELPPVAPLGKGFHPRIRKKFARTFPIDPGREPVNIRWGALHDDAFFKLDLQTSTIWLNQKYRRRLTGLDRSGANDAPMIKTTLFLMLQPFLAKQWLQSTTVEQLEAWQESLNLAADVELDIWEDGD